MNKPKIKITLIHYPNGTIAYRVSGTVLGKFRRQNFNNEADALTVKQNWERENLNMVPLPTITTRLTGDQVAEAESCFHRLQGSALPTLSFAVDFALRTYRPSLKSIPVQDAFSRFIAAKAQQNVRPATLDKLNAKLAGLRRHHGTAWVHELQADQMRALIFRDGCGPQTQQTTYRCLTNFFNWCKLNDYCPASPMDKIPGIELEQGEPEIFTVPQARRLLAAAQEYKEGVLLPYVVLALFCAVRPTELARLSWEDINLAAGTVKISARIAKMRGRRVVEIPDNAGQFLLPHAVKKTPFVGVNWQRNFVAVRKLAGITHFPQDVLRHTGISFHFAKHEHEGKTASWAGNSPDMIHKHYKGIMEDPKDVADFYAITPDTLAASIVPMVQAA